MHCVAVKPRIRLGLWLASCVAGGLVAILAIILNQHPANAAINSGGLVYFGTLIWVYTFLGSSNFTALVRDNPAAPLTKAAILTLGFSGLYGAYALATGSADEGHWWWYSAGVAGLSLLVATSPVGRQTLTWQDAVFMVVAWAALDSRLIMTWWPWPQGQGAWAFANLTLVPLTLLLMIGVRGLRDTTLSFHLPRSAWLVMIRNLNWCTLAIIPCGYLVGFVRWHPIDLDAITIGARYLGILVTVAIPEELFFRGLLLNLLHKSMAGRWLPQAVAAVVFGLSHFNNQAYPGGPLPDYRYVLFASIAGYFYGRIYLRSGLFAAALVHAMMDTVWIHLFRGP